MTMPDDAAGSSKAYRADFYLFRHFLMGLGTFSDGKVGSPSSMKLIFGVNKTFRIRLEGEWFDARAALTGSSVPHYVNGEGDWQIILWIDADSALGTLLTHRALKGRSWAIHEDPGSLRIADIIQTVGDKPDAHAALSLAETLIRSYGDANPVPSTWDDQIREAMVLIDSNPGSMTVRLAAEAMRRRPEELDYDFRRVVGTGLDDYIHQSKWALYVELRHGGMDRSLALRQAGLPGWEGLKERFEARYGLDLEVLETGRPFVRVYCADSDKPVLYL